jgi:hypothetical protein
MTVAVWQAFPALDAQCPQRPQLGPLPCAGHGDDAFLGALPPCGRHVRVFEAHVQGKGKCHIVIEHMASTLQGPHVVV